MIPIFISLVFESTFYMDSKRASRKLGYGFSTQHQEISLTDFVVNAKKELEAVPVFDPWRHIAVEKKVKRFLDNESQEDAANNEKSYSKEYKKTLQKHLQEAGFYRSKIDGDFGKGTRAAIIDWQKSIKKNETGYLTKKQIKALNQTYGGFLGHGYPREMQNLHLYDLSTSDLRYPTSIKLAVNHLKEMDSERDRLRELQAEDKISEAEVYRLWWKKYNSFTWWRDTQTRSIDVVYGDTPTFNRFWHFWINYFPISVDAVEAELFGNYYLTIRKNMASSFSELLYDATWHPAMQEYLSNGESTGPNSRRARDIKKNREKKIAAINENLARELLELFTLTPAAGYTQDDVNGTAYVLTGWGQVWNDDVKEGYFDDYRHEPGAHKVLGKKYRGKPKDKLKALCIDLALHPMTARHVANKLSVHFISDSPPEEAIQFIENIYNQSSGDLVQVHQAVVDAVIKYGDNYTKFLQPELWFFNVHKAIDGGLPLKFLGQSDDWGHEQTNNILYELGHLNSRTPQPNGWSDLAVDWLTPEMMDRRVRYIIQLIPKIEYKLKFDPDQYAVKFFGKNSIEAKDVKDTSSYTSACLKIFCHPKFMRT
jgi:uncharacterized protein (DUF1800 family)